MQIWLCAAVAGFCNGLGHCNYSVLRCDIGAGDVFVFEKCHSGDMGRSGGGQRESPTLIVSEGGTNDKCFSAALSKCTMHVGLVVDQCLYADGHEWVPVIVLMAIDLRVGGDGRCCS